MTAPAQPPGALGELRVLKKQAPDSPGALKLARQRGAALVCARHRTDARGDTCCTTVELLVDQASAQARVGRAVDIRIGLNERALQGVLRGAGARWAHWATGPLGRWATGPLGRWATGPTAAPAAAGGLHPQTGWSHRQPVAADGFHLYLHMAAGGNMWLRAPARCRHQEDRCSIT